MPFIEQLTNQVTNTFELSPSRETNGSSASSEISLSLWNPKLPYSDPNVSSPTPEILFF
jgi:hypothetical protein